MSFNTIKVNDTDTNYTHSIFDISEYNSGAIYANLSAALATIPQNKKQGGMTVKFIQTISQAQYSVVKTEGLETEPSGTLLSEAPYIDSGTYDESQLITIFSTLPSDTGASHAVTYYVAVTVDETTTYTSWVITKVQNIDNKYVQYRLVSADWSTNTSYWKNAIADSQVGEVVLWPLQGTTTHSTSALTATYHEEGNFIRIEKVSGGSGDYVAGFALPAMQDGATYKLSFTMTENRKSPSNACVAYLRGKANTTGLDVLAPIASTKDSNYATRSYPATSGTTIDAEYVFTYDRKTFKADYIICQRRHLYTIGFYVDFSNLSLERLSVDNTLFRSVLGVPIPMLTGYIATNTDVIDYTVLNASTAVWRHAIVECMVNEEFTINSKGGTVPRAWCFVDNEDNVLEVADAGITLERTVIKAPANTAKLIINNSNPEDVCYRGKFLLPSDLQETINEHTSQLAALYPVDNVPTKNSSRPVKSSAVYTALQSKLDGKRNDYTNKLGAWMHKYAEGLYVTTVVDGLDLTMTIVNKSGNAKYDNVSMLISKLALNTPYLLEFDVHYSGEKTIGFWYGASYGGDNMSNRPQVPNIAINKNSTRISVEITRLNSKSYVYLTIPLKQFNNGDMLTITNLTVRDVNVDDYVGKSELNDYKTDQETAENYNSETRQRILQASYYGNNVKALDILHFSDLHAAEIALGDIIDVYYKYESHIDVVLNTGDITNFNDSDTWYKSTGIADYALFCIGNHDAYKEERSTYMRDASERECYMKYLAPYIDSWEVVQPDNAGIEVINPDTGEDDGYYPCYYYKDFADKMVRLICVDTEHAVRSASIPARAYWPEEAERQYQWLVGVLNDARENGFAVVIAAHVNPPYGGEYGGGAIDCPFNQYGSSSYTHETFPLEPTFVTAVDEFINAGGIFACWLCGHKHSDLLAHAYANGSDNPQLVIIIEKAGNTRDELNSYRGIGQKCEYSANIVTIVNSGSTRWIRVVRVGNNMDHQMRVKNAFCYDYLNHKLMGFH